MVIDKDSVRSLSNNISDLDFCSTVCINWRTDKIPRRNIIFQLEEIAIYTNEKTDDNTLEKIQDCLQESELDDALSISESKNEFITRDKEDAIILFKKPETDV